MPRSILPASEMMTRDEIRELAVFQADETKGACALSFYLQPDPPQDRSHRRKERQIRRSEIGAHRLTAACLPADLDHSQNLAIHEHRRTHDLLNGQGFFLLGKVDGFKYCRVLVSGKVVHDLAAFVTNGLCRQRVRGGNGNGSHDRELDGEEKTQDLAVCRKAQDGNFLLLRFESARDLRRQTIQTLVRGSSPGLAHLVDNFGYS